MRDQQDHPGNGHPPVPDGGPVDFFYTSSGPDMPYADEIKTLAADSDLVHVHFVDSRDGRLTAQQVLASAREKPAALSAFLCGPASMVRNFESAFRHAGVPSRNIYREYFDWR